MATRSWANYMSVGGTVNFQYPLKYPHVRSARDDTQRFV